MRRVNRSAILSGVSLKASNYEDRVVNAIDNRTRSERRDQAVAKPTYYERTHCNVVWDERSKQVTRSWSF